MFRGVSVILGIGLIILSIAAMSVHAVLWLTWLDGLAGIAAIVMGLSIAATARAGASGSGLLAFGLFILWIVGLTQGRSLWLAWWTFAFACAFMVLSGSALSGERRLHRRPA